MKCKECGGSGFNEKITNSRLNHGSGCSIHGNVRYCNNCGPCEFKTCFPCPRCKGSGKLKKCMKCYGKGHYKKVDDSWPPVEYTVDCSCINGYVPEGE